MMTQTDIMRTDITRPYADFLKVLRRETDLLSEDLKSAVNPSDNFENLFEMPVLFYVAALLIFVTGLTDPIYVFGAWAFVALRAIHSIVHCTYNKIMHRFYFYAASSIVLWLMWFRISYQLL